MLYVAIGRATVSVAAAVSVADAAVLNLPDSVAGDRVAVIVTANDDDGGDDDDDDDKGGVYGRCSRGA
jgi:acyl-CoA synthetase (AMP-forming)/AMP-acid ligase II